MPYLININHLNFVMVKCAVLFEVRTELLMLHRSVSSSRFNVIMHRVKFLGWGSSG
jgi:hypothetical protein